MLYNFAILKNESPKEHLEWVQAIKNVSEDIKYKIIDFTHHDWLEQCLSENFDFYLTRPPGETSFFKLLYDERLYILHFILNKKIYPSYEEILIYENKRMLYYWLDANKISHAKTWIFYHKDKALQFAENCKFPIVAKTSIGGAGFGVKILKDRFKIKNYINKAFSKKGIKRKFLPSRRKGEIKKRVSNALIHPEEIYQKIRRRFITSSRDPQKWFVIFQEYIDAESEWRTVRIGDSFFAHKKKRRGEIFSGGGGIDWEAPSEKLLDFMKYVTDKRKFLGLSIDIFEDKEGNFYVNELQCFFGFIHPKHQMIINDIPGRFIKKK